MGENTFCIVPIVGKEGLILHEVDKTFFQIELNQHEADGSHWPQLAEGPHLAEGLQCLAESALRNTLCKH